MKILEKGPGWSIEQFCTGKGNGNGGCNSKLLVEKGDISSKQSKEVFYKILEDKKSPSEIVKSLGMKQIGYEDTLRPMIVKIIEEHLDLIEEYRKGRNVFDFLVGQVMKQTRGQANPSLTAKIIKEEIDKR